MRIFKKQVSVDDTKLFKSNGEFNLTLEVANFLDTILIILLVKKQSDLNNMNLELRKCGFFISNPNLKKVAIKLIKDGLVSDNSFSLN